MQRSFKKRRYVIFYWMMRREALRNTSSAGALPPLLHMLKFAVPNATAPIVPSLVARGAANTVEGCWKLTWNWLGVISE